MLNTATFLRLESECHCESSHCASQCMFDACVKGGRTSTPSSQAAFLKAILKPLAWCGKCGLCTREEQRVRRSIRSFLCRNRMETRAWQGFCGKGGWHGCTISGHPPVNSVHSIENACTYKHVFFVDWICRRSTTRSFFDSFQVLPVGAASGAQAESLSRSQDGERG